MALHLILRNSTKLQGLNLPKAIFKFTPIATSPNNQLWTQNNNQSLIKRVNPSKLSLPQIRSMSGDHGKLWTIERIVAVGLLGIVPAAIASPNPVLDNVLACVAIVHVHWGFEAIVIDYVRPVLFGNVIPKLSLGLLYIITAATLGGLIYYNINDIGIGQTIRKLWTITREQEQAEPEPESEVAQVK